VIISDSYFYSPSSFLSAWIMLTRGKKCTFGSAFLKLFDPSAFRAIGTDSAIGTLSPHSPSVPTLSGVFPVNALTELCPNNIFIVDPFLLTTDAAVRQT
jgi:hypothetical protein